MLISASKSFGQDGIPYGTEGEVMDTVKSGNHKYSDWNKFEGSLMNLHLGGGFLLDYATYVQDSVSDQQIDMKGGVKVRDFRLTISGAFKFEKRDVSWKAGLMYNGDNKEWLVRETGVLIGLPEISGHIFVGRTKEGISMNKIMNGYAGWTPERQMALDVLPILADGVKYMGYLPKQRLFWNVGIFIDWASKDHTFSTYRWQTAARFGWLPVYKDEGNTQLHLGMSARYGKVDGGEISVKSKPEVNSAPFFLNTEVFETDHSYHLGWEAYLTAGSWMLGSEYYLHKFDTPETSDPTFHGGEAVITYIITGEKRAYSTVSNVYGFIPVDVENSVFRGGSGTWEAVVRFSILDLDSGALTGGRFWRLSPIVNWYMNRNIRLVLAYGFGVLDRFDQTGRTHFFQTRIHFML